MQIKLSRYISQFLVDAGITRAFSVVGGGAMHLNEAIGHQEGMQVIYNHHEQASAIAAECYGRLAKNMALLCVTTGPGGTNAITGVLGAWLDSIPMIVISGQVRYELTARASGTGVRAIGDQEFDICKSISCMTKYSEMVIDPKRIRYCLEKALYLAKSGRPGPVWLDIPLDVQAVTIETDELVGFDIENYEAGGDGFKEASDCKIKEDDKGFGEVRQKLPSKVTDEQARSIIEKLRQAKRPVIHVGNGIRIANAHAQFIEFINKLGIPVTVGWNSEDCLWNDHPLYVGRPGNFGDRPGNFAVQNSDVFFSIGARMSIRQVGFNTKGWARAAYTIINDIDEEELKKPTLHVSMPVHADCKDLLEALNRVLDSEATPVWKDMQGYGLDGKNWLDTCMMWKNKYPVVTDKQLAYNLNPANVYAFIYEISRRLKENQITVVGNGSACVVGGQAYIIKRGQRFVSNSAVASMGYDLPAAIGAVMAVKDNPIYDKDIILVTGDGSMQMNLQELQTIIHHRMPIKIFVVNNGGYHSIRQTQNKFFGDEPLVGIGIDSRDLSFPNLRKLAAAYGYNYVGAYNNSELGKAVELTLNSNAPTICEAFVDMYQNFEPKLSSKQLANGSMYSPPLEDLAPFLSKEELKSNMIIPLYDEDKE